MKKFAGCWRRYWAFNIDGVILLILVKVKNQLLLLLNTVDTFQKTVEHIAAVFMLLISLLYFVLMESSSKQATLGKMVLGIKAVDIN